MLEETVGDRAGKAEEMSAGLAAVPRREPQLLSGPVHRSIVAVDLEGSTRRPNPVKGELRRAMYDLLNEALHAAGITARHLERPTDLGDGVMMLIRPHDDVPKTVLLGLLIPKLTDLLIRHNAAADRPELRMRMRAVVHAGEVHEDERGFYGDDIDVAVRLLDSRPVKRALREKPASPLVLVVSEEFFSAIVGQGYVDGGPYRQRVKVLVGERLRRGRIRVLGPSCSGCTGTRRARPRRPSRAVALAEERARVAAGMTEAGRLPGLSEPGGPRQAPERSGVGRR
jgi:hypothetical protein